MTIYMKMIPRIFPVSPRPGNEGSEAFQGPEKSHVQASMAGTGRAL
jgi:hypothetical protein